MNKYHLWATISLLFLLSSCSSIYMPNVPAVPMLSEAGEFHGGAHVSLKGDISANAALAVSNHIAVIANGSFVDGDYKKKNFKQTLWEIGGGYFDTFGPNEKRIFEIYGGYGQGITDRDYKDLTYDGPLISETQDVKFSKSFIQLNYSAKKNKELKLFGKKYPLNYGTALRISYVNMLSFKKDGLMQTKEDNVFLEPIFFTRMYISNSMQLQYTSGSNFGLINRDYLTAGNSVFTLGVVFNVGAKR